MSQQLLIIGLVWPEPKSSAAGSRMLQLIEQFQQLHYNIIFASAAGKTERSYNLTAININEQSIKLNDDSFDTFIQELQPDIVLFDRFITEEQFGWRVAEHCPNAIRILDTEDFHGLRKARALALKDNADLNHAYLQNDTTKREIASIYRCDLSLMISEAEMDILTETFQIEANLLLYLPFLLDAIPENVQATHPKYNERQHFITIGNFLHPPNYDAVLHLKQNIWPLIRQQLPKAELHIYGAYASQKVTQLHNESQGFLIKGYTDDVTTVMQDAKVCLAPLRFGAGLKGKLIDAMQNGTPCMMSSIAAEGMFGDLNANGYIENTPEAFAKQAVALYQNAEAWQAFQKNGYHIINHRFSKHTFKTVFKSKIDDLSTNLEQYRTQNFTGQLLMHHTMQSTKYMSKWIEAKNR